MRRSKSIASEEDRDKQSLMAHSATHTETEREIVWRSKLEMKENSFFHLLTSFDVFNGMYRML